MTDQPGSARFQTLLESALQAYEKKNGVTLADSEDSLAIRLQSCHSIDDITTLLQDKTQAFDDFRQRDIIFKSIKATVSILTPISALVSVADDAGLKLFPHTKAIHSTIGILLTAADGVITSCDVLTEMLESIETFINRLRIYAGMSHSMPVVDEIVVKLMVELISTLALVARKLKKRRSLKWVKNFFAVKDISKARQGLERLLQEEDRAVGAQTLKSVEDNKASTDGVRNVLDRMTSDMDASKRAKLLRDIQNWLSPPDPWKNFNTAHESRYSKTGEWFIKGNTLAKWKVSGPSSLLWVNGKPGAGKSILCSAIIEEIKTMQKSGLASLAIFYYDFREERKKHVSGLLASVLFQLCDQSDSYCEILSAFYSAHRNGAQSPGDDELVQCLMDLLKRPGLRPVYLVIDALDECPSTSSLSSPRENLLSLLEELVDAQLPNLRICVTSRPEVDITAILKPLAFRSVSLHDEDGQKQDIMKYIESIVNTNKNMQNWKPEHKQLVIDVLTEKADGMFRWVYCQLAYLADCFPGNIQDILNELPATLDETYERTLREIKEGKWESAKRLLFCVAAAFRPLRVEELAEILAFDYKSGAIPKFHEDWRLQNPVEAILSACPTLLSVVNVETYRETSRVVQFSHFTVKEFLVSSRFAEKHDNISRRYHISMSCAHTFVTQACLGVLLHLDKSITSRSLLQFPLAGYAAQHWVEHARFEGVSQHVVEGMKPLFDQTKPHFSIWLWIHDPTATHLGPRERAEGPSPPHGTPLHYAAFCGLHDIAEVLAIEHPPGVNSPNFHYALTPLHMASLKDHADLARMLIERGADVSARDDDERTALNMVSSIGHVDVAQMLIECGADVSAQENEYGWTSLHMALEAGHVDLARMLVEHGADVSAQRKDGWAALHWASRDGHVGLAQMLLDRGADVSAQSEDGWTAPQLALDLGRVDLARMLIQRGADLSARNKDGWTALHLASCTGRADIARTFVDRGADLSAQNNEGSTALHLASCNGHVDFARILAESGAGVSSQKKDGSTPLHLATRNSHVELTRMLLECGADVSAKNENGSTALHFTSENGNVDLTRTLIERGADISARMKVGWTPLHLASRIGHVDLARILIECGADVAAQNEDGWTALHLASRNGHMDLARMLVERGADVSVQRNDGWTALHLASRGGHVDLARMLVEYGADESVQTKNGWTALRLASKNGHSPEHRDITSTSTTFQQPPPPRKNLRQRTW